MSFDGTCTTLTSTNAHVDVPKLVVLDIDKVYRLSRHFSLQWYRGKKKQTLGQVDGGCCLLFLNFVKYKTKLVFFFQSMRRDCCSFLFLTAASFLCSINLHNMTLTTLQCLPSLLIQSFKSQRGNGVEQKINIPCVMKNSSSCDSVANSRAKKKFFQVTEPPRPSAFIRTRENVGALSPLRFIAKVGAVTSREETPFIGKPYDGKREERKKA